MIAPLTAVFSLLATQAAAPSLEDAFMAALAAGDGAAARALLAEDATIMHERSGPAEPATAAEIAAFLRGCRGEILLEAAGEEPGAMAYTTGWTCGERGQAQMLLWTANGRIVWVQLLRLEPQPAADN